MVCQRTCALGIFPLENCLLPVSHLSFGQLLGIGVHEVHLIRMLSGAHHAPRQRLGPGLLTVGPLAPELAAASMDESHAWHFSGRRARRGSMPRARAAVAQRATWREREKPRASQSYLKPKYPGQTLRSKGRTALLRFLPPECPRLTLKGDAGPHPPIHRHDPCSNRYGREGVWGRFEERG